MPNARASKKTQASVLPLNEIRQRVGRIRKDVEGAVETIGKRAVDILPRQQRKQVDEVLDRINSVRGDMNKAVESWRADLEKSFKVVRGTVDKRILALRKETQSRSQTLAGTVEKETRKYVERVFKQLRLPVRGDVDGLRRRLNALERRVQELEKSEGRAVA
jgi:BMFP domain-containing protein YqiC